MSKYLTIKGKTHEAKFKHLEVILRRLSRRLHKVITTVIPPSPIFGYCEAPTREGLITRCVFPAPGEVTRICMAISEFADKKRVQFDAELLRFDIHGQRGDRIQKSFETRKHIHIVDIGFRVQTGDCLTFSTLVDPEKGPMVRGIWSSILYIIDMPEGRVKEISFDELDRLIEEGMDNEGV